LVQLYYTRGFAAGKPVPARPEGQYVQSQMLASGLQNDERLTMNDTFAKKPPPEGDGCPL
ncbi:hypothetical protein, partial [Acidaminococcus massiliensis]